MEPVIKKDIGGSVSTFHYDDETVATAGQLSGVTCTVFKPGGSELISQTSITPDASGEIIKTISAADSASSYEWCRAQFQYTYSTQVYQQDIYFHIARTDFDIPFHYADLIKFGPDLGDYTWAGDDFFYRQRDVTQLDLYGRLLNAGYKPWRILNRSALEVPFAYLWLSHIYLTLSKHPEDDFRARSDDYMRKYEQSFAKVNLIQTATDDADIGPRSSWPMGRTRLRRG